MEDSLLSKELIEAFRPIMDMNNARFRQVKTMLAGFIATQERDLNYMDEYMDVLFDFMDPESDTEMLMRQYYDYIATFDADEARKRIDSLENDMGYRQKSYMPRDWWLKSYTRDRLTKGATITLNLTF